MAGGDEDSESSEVNYPEQFQFDSSFLVLFLYYFKFIKLIDFNRKGKAKGF